MMMKQTPRYKIKRMWEKDAGKGRAEQVSVSRIISKRLVDRRKVLHFLHAFSFMSELHMLYRYKIDPVRQCDDASQHVDE
jgi:hypothetical protein